MTGKQFVDRGFLFHIAISLFALSVFFASGKAQAQGKKTPAKGALTPGRSYGSLKVTSGQPGSVIFINNIRHGLTNEAGTVEIKRLWTGSFAARVRTVGFTDWQGRVIIRANTASLLKVTQTATNDPALLQYQKG